MMHAVKGTISSNYAFSSLHNEQRQILEGRQPLELGLEPVVSLINSAYPVLEGRVCC